MQYMPLTEEQASEMIKPKLLDDGIYKFQLIEFNHNNKYGNQLLDKNGDPMTNIKLNVFCEGGKERFVFATLFWGSKNKMAYRTRHFSESIKILKLYESGKMMEKFSICLNLFGLCEIYTQKERPKNDGSGESWSAKNDVRDFIFEEKNKKPEFDFNDDIPL